MGKKKGSSLLFFFFFFLFSWGAKKWWFDYFILRHPNTLILSNVPCRHTLICKWNITKKIHNLVLNAGKDSFYRYFTTCVCRKCLGWVLFVNCSFNIEASSTDIPQQITVKNPSLRVGEKKLHTSQDTQNNTLV